MCDWLAHAMERHAAMRALADAHGNLLLGAMVPFGDTEHGVEVAVDLRMERPRIVWLDPSRYDGGETALVAVAAESIDTYVGARLA
jgi:hypothetical protein